MISEYTNFNYKNGRRYHASPQGEEYWLPNDEKQNETLDIFFYTHHAFRLSLEGKLYLAPIQNNVQTVLDVGTGTGIWAIDFADEHPSARVIGTDISPIQPTWVPPNLEFQIDDCCQEWTFKEKFDCVHCRAMIGSIPDWNALTKQAFKALKPGGHIEFHERLMHFASDDDTVKESSSMKAWGDFWEQTGTRSKRAFTIVEDGTLETSMMAAGFADIEEHDFKMPVGPWPMDLRLKEIGSYILAALDNDLEGFVLRPAIELLGWSEEEALLFVARLRTEMRSGKPHAYILHKVVGRKPN
ncbi:S-adenosyl-L-methionine-dependent methyltransferase [Dactylonectria macrodidyma]|uniref:S-adenosyl-L-methionine-dependent methyltransferase n=1 Tax=Dactylonectria macrodidyma TaxID=307937 RepID=A0A9P9IEY1_9HYPO|nr:S-adenosyl-L-methionine-dependent methyltransferase [Dactylonectria macrodidyma]